MRFGSKSRAAHINFDLVVTKRPLAQRAQAKLRMKCRRVTLGPSLMLLSCGVGESTLSKPIDDGASDLDGDFQRDLRPAGPNQ